jgi:hypothetical protein
MYPTPAVHRLQLLVRPDRRQPDQLQKAADAARKLGFEVTGVGSASLSGRLAHPAYESLFGQQPASNQTQDTELPVPRALSDFVASITEAPPHLLMDEQPKEGTR